MDTAIYKCPVTGLYFDPLAVQRRLLLLSRGQINDWLRDQRGEDELVSLAAEDKLLPVVREAFGLVPINIDTGDGLLDSDCLRILQFYLDWLNAKKVKGPSSQTESPCADCPQKG